MRDNCESAFAELDATLAEVKRDRDEEWTRLKAALAAMTAERDVLEAALKTTAEERDDWKRRAELARATAHSLAAKLETVGAIVAQAITDPYLIAHLEAAFATTGQPAEKG